MKVIITGATGFVGGWVFRYALAHPAITHIVLLQRRELQNPLALTAAKNAGKRIETVVHADFSTYPDAVLERLSGSEAVLWALGGKHDNFPDLATAETVNIDYTRAAALAFERSVAPMVPAGRRFRFVLCSGHGALWDNGNGVGRVWIFAETRRMKGAAEQAVFAMAKAQPDIIEAYTCRPAVILPPEPSMLEWLHGAIAPSVNVKELAATMVELGASGSDQRFWEYSMCGRTGKQIVKERQI